ncbi:hypothetical protein Neosp_011714 [[Neocosmospora] mangrovei]
MAPTTLQPLTFNDPGDLRIVLVPTSDDGDTVSEHPPSVVNHRFSTDSYRSYKAPNQDIPTHPVPAMQEAFAESLDEVTSGGDGPGKPKLRDLDAQGRRARLLEQDAEDEPYDTTWRYRPGQQQHEMYKLISQITFGVYLLLNSLAADNGQVVTILQGHIDEVDEFLEVMLEDFAQAHKDLTERIAHLQLPMANRQAFEGMLEDRNFRAQILSGNEKIDHILARTNAAMKQWDDDIDAGLRSSEAFMEWLNEHKDTKWPDSEPDLNSIFLAMKGNADGWLNAFDELNNQAQDLNGLIIKLMTIVAEMEKTAGEVSRKTWATIPPFSLPVNAPRDSTASSSSPSIKSDPKSTPVASIRSSKSTTTLPAASLKAKDPEVNTLNDVSTLSDFPLPGAAPLLPPTRFTPRPSPNLSTSSSSSGPHLSASSPRSSGATTPKASVTEEKQEEPEAGDDLGGLNDGPLFILQPRTYTPQPPATPVTPVVNRPESPKFEEQFQRQTLTQPIRESVGLAQPVRESTGYAQPVRESTGYAQPVRESVGFTQSVRESVGLEKRTSLRQRVSQKTTPPVSIQIPPRNTIEIQSSLRPSPGGITPRTSKSQAPDYSHASDLEAYQPHRLPRATSHADFGTPPVRPLMPSPHSEHHQFYHNTIPVRASPHSPLQQRPHTAGPADQYHQSGYFPGHQRNQPSRMGAMSTLSSVTTATYDDAATVTSRATTQAGGKRVKKKKSAFGWLKKAFSMDEDEKAEYEARRAMQYRDNYYDGHSPKFLDGRRIR